jgi:hypothetical protein
MSAANGTFHAVATIEKCCKPHKYKAETDQPWPGYVAEQKADHLLHAGAVLKIFANRKIKPFITYFRALKKKLSHDETI